MPHLGWDCDALGTDSVLLVVDHPRLEEKLIYNSLKEKGLKVGILNVTTTPLPINGVKIPEIALIRTVGMFRGVRSSAVLESMGSHSINSSSTIMTCGDKVLTYSALSKLGIPIPKSLLALGRDAVLKAYGEFQGVVVDKPPLGSWGRMVSLIKSAEMAVQIADARGMMPSSLRGHVIQEYIETGGRDIRCLVLGERTIGCMERMASTGWKSNVALGGKVRPIKATSVVEELSLKAAEAVKGEFVAVDLLSNEEVLVNEVNGVPEFKGFIKATGIDVAKELASYIWEVLRS
ncbi:MAG: RimK family alpha-L-glutamate ligase [Candidatus Korarchaeota archaeon]|nr:RimK family alpha-L-glutamate ligase [Candidatus Korarchaeota archaeon]